jgi:hypothetical protein
VYVSGVLSTGIYKYQENVVCFEEDSLKYRVCDPPEIVTEVCTV